jgi:3-deoxy-D-manno-octulosonic-acid transferase
VKRSSGAPITKDTQVLLFDTIGEMGLAYSLSKISFVCGSTISGLSGHNPLEPARLDNAVLTGVHISSFADTYMGMFTFKAAKRILTSEDIGPTLLHLFSDTIALRELRDNAKAFANSRDAVLDYVWSQHIEVKN